MHCAARQRKDPTLYTAPERTDASPRVRSGEGTRGLRHQKREQLPGTTTKNARCRGQQDMSAAADSGGVPGTAILGDERSRRDMPWPYYPLLAGYLTPGSLLFLMRAARPPVDPMPHICLTSIALPMILYLQPTISIYPIVYLDKDLRGCLSGTACCTYVLRWSSPSHLPPSRSRRFAHGRR